MVSAEEQGLGWVNRPAELVVGPDEQSKPVKLKYTIKELRFFTKITRINDN